MNTYELLIKIMDEVLGFPADELKENEDLNLIEDGLIDSLSSVMIINEAEKRLGKKLDIRKMNPADFTSVEKIAAAIDAQ